jgi:hypothetical protein
MERFIRSAGRFARRFEALQARRSYPMKAHEQPGYHAVTPTGENAMMYARAPYDASVIGAIVGTRIRHEMRACTPVAFVQAAHMVARPRAMQATLPGKARGSCASRRRAAHTES